MGELILYGINKEMGGGGALVSEHAERPQVFVWGKGPTKNWLECVSGEGESKQHNLFNV